MAGEDILPPADQVSAGGAPAPADSQAIVEALRSGGTMPGAALANLQQPPPQQYALPLANIGSAIGSGGLAAMGGRPGTNPYLTGLDDQQRSLFYQQLHAQQEQDRRTDRAFAQNKTLLTIEKGVLDSLEEGPLKDKLAQQYAQRLSQFTGNPLLGGVGAALATKKLSTEQMNGVLMDGAQKMDPQLIALRHQIPVDEVKQILAIDPKTLERLGADDQRTRESKILDFKIKEATLAEKEHPELKGDAREVHLMLATHQKLFGKDYQQGDTQSRAKAYDLAHAQYQAEEERKLRIKSQLDMEKAIEVAMIRAQTQAQLAANRPLSPLQKTKALEPLTKARGTMEAVRKLEDIVDQIPEDALPQSENIASQLWAKYKRNSKYPGNTAIQQFEQWWGPVAIGQIDRGMFDEKGLRAIQAFTKQVGMVDNLPPRQAIKDYLGTIKTHLTNKMGSDISDMEDLNYPPDVVGVAKKTVGPYLPKSLEPKTLPSSPLTPPADLTYDIKTGTWGRPGGKK